MWGHELESLFQLPLGVTSPEPEQSANKRPCKLESHWLGAHVLHPWGRGTLLPTHYGLGVLLELGFIIRPVGLLQQVRQESLEYKRPLQSP